MGLRRVIVCTAVLLAASSGTAFASDGEFTIREVTSAEKPVNSLKRAALLLNGDMPSASDETFSAPFINFLHSSGSSRKLRFADATVSPTLDSASTHNTAVQITTQVDIPTAGIWSFGITTDNVASFAINGTLFRDARHGLSTTRIKPINFGTAGSYSLSVTYLQRPHRSAVELYSSPGRFHRFHAHGANFQLIGGAANGALALTGSGSISGDPTGVGNPPQVGGGQSPMLIASGNTLSVGADATTTGLLTTGNEEWDGGATYDWKINNSDGVAGTSNGWDEVTMPALSVVSASPTDPFTVAPHSFNGNTPGTPAGVAAGSTHTWTIAHSDSPLTIDGAPAPIGNLLDTGAFALDTSAFTVNGSQVPASDFQLNLIPAGTGNDVQLVFASAPEPATALLLAAAIAPALFGRRRIPGSRNSSLGR